MNNHSVQIFLVKFKNEISFHEIPLLRGAILGALGEKAELLFHNHVDETTFRYSYPLIQYKRIKKKAAVFCIDKGVETIGQFLALQDFEVSLGNRAVKLEIESILPKRALIQIWDSTFRYRVRKWLALNSENYQKYMELDECTARIAYLERMLIGNLLSFAKGIGLSLEKELVCKLISLEEPTLISAKGVKMMAFDAEFKSNLSLPDYMGIGKHVSLGFGTVVRVYNENNEKQQR